MVISLDQLGRRLERIAQATNFPGDWHIKITSTPLDKSRRACLYLLVGYQGRYAGQYYHYRAEDSQALIARVAQDFESYALTRQDLLQEPQHDFPIVI